MKKLIARFWPSSLTGRLFLAVAITLLIAQSFNAFLLYRGQTEQRTAMLTNALAVRMVRGVDRLDNLARAGLDPQEVLSEQRGWGARFRQRGANNERGNRGRGARGGAGAGGGGFDGRGRPRARGLDYSETNPIGTDWQRLTIIEQRLQTLLISYNVRADNIIVARDPRPRILRPEQLAAANGGAAASEAMIISALKLPDGNWLSVRVPQPAGERGIRGWLIFQTVSLYLLLLAVIFYITRTLSRPLKRLNTAMGDFAQRQNISNLPEQGPQDVADLTRNFNRMSQHIGAMLDEKDIMLGAIGHDLKTPLSALRVRVESVADERLRSKMIASIDDLHRSLDEILLLARVGRGQEEAETVNIGALIDTLADEFVQLDQSVDLQSAPRIVGQIYDSWFRRAIRNIIGNAVRYGGAARVHLETFQDDSKDQIAIHVDDDGPGIAVEELDKIFTPFYRLEKSRNTKTGGAGLGLTLARAIAEKHRGSITLKNRYDDSGTVSGLRATFVFPAQQSN